MANEIKITKKLIKSTFDYVAHSVTLNMTEKQYVDYVSSKWDDHCEAMLTKWWKLDPNRVHMANPNATEAERIEACKRIAAEFAIEDLFRSRYLSAK